MTGLRAALCVCVVGVLLAAPCIGSAQTIWERIATPSLAATSELERGRALEQGGDLEGALAVYRDVGLHDDPEVARLYELRALSSRPEEVLQLTAPALETEPSEYRSQQLFFRSLALMELQRVDEAAEVLRDATRFQASLPGAELFLSNLAECYAAQGQPEVAAIYFRQALTKNPSYFAASMGLAVALLRSGETEESARTVTSAIDGGATVAAVQAQVPYTLVAGERALYEALLLEGAGDASAAASAMAAHRESDAARLTDPSVLEQLTRRIGSPWLSVTSVDIGECYPMWASTVREGRMAAMCSDGSLRGYAMEDGRPTETDRWETGYNVEAAALQADGSVVTVAWDATEVRRFAPAEAEESRVPIPPSAQGYGPRFFSQDGEVLWRYDQDAQLAIAWRMNANATPVVIPINRQVWGYGYASSPTGQRFVAQLGGEYMFVAADGSVSFFTGLDLDVVPVAVLVGDRPGFMVEVFAAEVRWRDDSGSRLQRWRVPPGNALIGGAITANNTLVVWSDARVWTLTGTPL